MANPSVAIFKTCKVCGESKLLTGFRKWLCTCKECMREIKRKKAVEYYHQHKDSPEFKAKTKERFQRERTDNRQAYLQKKREAYLRNKEEYNANWHARRAAAAGVAEIDRSITISSLLKRDKHMCGICGLPIVENAKTRNERASIDHIVPLKAGGSHTWNNVRAAHYGCNNSKGNRLDGTYSPNLSFLQTADNSIGQKPAYQPSLPM